MDQNHRPDADPDPRADPDAPADRDAPATPDDDQTPPPERVCRRCSTVAATAGEFCPHCGTSYLRRRRPRRPSRRAGRLITAVAVLLLVVGGGTGVVLKGRADDRADRRERAERNLERVRAQAREQRRQRAAAAAAEQRASDEAGEEIERIERRLRTTTVRELRQAITKDARSQAAEGLLDDRATSTSCDNTDGREDDLDESSAEYSCIAVTETTADGESRGYRFTGRIDFEEGSYTWRLGD